MKDYFVLAQSSVCQRCGKFYSRHCQRTFRCPRYAMNRGKTFVPKLTVRQEQYGWMKLFNARAYLAKSFGFDGWTDDGDKAAFTLLCKLMEGDKSKPFIMRAIVNGE